MPPRIVRRVLLHPIQMIVGMVLLVVLLVASLVTSLLELPTARKRLTRVLLTMATVIGVDLSVVAGAWWLWLRAAVRDRSRPGGSEGWRSDHVALLGRALSRAVACTERILRLRLNVDIDDAVQTHTGPLLVLTRHGGVGDSPLVAMLITTRLHRAPRVVLKRWLQWDAAIDLVLGRLGAYFLPSHRMSQDRREAELAAFARGINRDDDAVLLFPEGRNWTPDRWKDAVADADGDEATWMRTHPTVLPPHAGGASLFLQESPDLQVVIAAHRGLELLNSVSTVWRGIPLTEPVQIRLRTSNAPTDHDALEQWLRVRWAAIDRWTRAGSDESTGEPVGEVRRR
ncbi:1-acyl-sn-glycerol-3-phosphate acyltransferase [Rudaeicoccus suwonensis]|uniref:1-acyl-sn-glycerol-3-phosphate acyltransferase n=1 Tax=Rudaeicoccus suwonensis TaxID=657409 RepID=UPI001BAB8BD5|nr:1-acyl-sn-glycerol-3-phosphate acyltransferase [Rudaeicoccus suwonensis]